jgi:hypothetical protein
MAYRSFALSFQYIVLLNSFTKILLLPICLLLTLNSSGSSPLCLKNHASTPILAKSIEDGWYAAIVKTGINAKYRLNVKVQYNSVVAIDFGNGGSVHTGFNNEGYVYSGGYLSVYGDNATATVTVSDGRELKYFYITLE